MTTDQLNDVIAVRELRNKWRELERKAHYLLEEVQGNLFDMREERYFKRRLSQPRSLVRLRLPKSTYETFRPKFLKHAQTFRKHRDNARHRADVIDKMLDTVENM